MSYKAYDNYKKSIIGWSNKIPNHWNIRKLKFLSKNKDNERVPISAEDREEGEYPYYGATGIVDYVNNYIFNEDLLLVGEDGAPFFDRNKDVAFLISGKTWVNNHAHVLKINQSIILDKIVMHSLNCTDYSIYIKGSTRDKLNQEQLKDIPIIIPPMNEQHQIANYLDKKTAKINVTIAKNEELIQLLEEKRVALINQVVTKGLNPDVPMKDSGVEWIGEIPEHWEMMKLKYHGSILGGYAFKSNDFTDFGVKVVKITNVQSMKFNWGECFYLPPTYLQEHSEFMINKGDIVFALTRPIISTGIKAAIYDENEPALANQRTGIFKKHTDSLLSQFLYYIIYSDYFKEDFKSKITATNQPNISPLDIGEIKIIIPPIKEQKDIITKLNKETSRINKAITKINDNIILLEEYKTSLIHHVVTGKIDVRGEEI